MPLHAPTAAPAAMATMMASHGFQPPNLISHAITQLVKHTFWPRERSNSPVVMISAWPQQTTASVTVWLRMLRRLFHVKKYCSPNISKEPMV